MAKHFFVPVFAGTNCDQESLSWFQDNFEGEHSFLDMEKHGDISPENVGAILVPGGFSYGDYLRAGAIASRDPKMAYVKKCADAGVPVLGICNGFQILCESGLLEGVLLTNITQHHLHFPVQLKAKKPSVAKCVWLPETLNDGSSQLFKDFQDFRVPMSCGMGRYQPNPKMAETDVAALEILEYVNNETGSFKAMAGITNSAGNVAGMMPHPERASDADCGATEGLVYLLGLAQNKNLKVKSGSPLEQFAKNYGERLP